MRRITTSESPPNEKKQLSLSLEWKSACEETFFICSCWMEEMKLVSKKAVPKNSTTAVNLEFRVFLDWVHHSKEVEGCSYTVQDLWRHPRSEDQRCLNIMNAKDECFTQLHTVLDKQSCKLYKQGVGASKILACVVTDALLHVSRSLRIEGLYF